VFKSNRQNPVIAPEVYAQIVETSSEAIFTTTLTGFITYWNGAAARLYGLNAQEMLGRNITSLIPLPVVDEYQALCERIKSSLRVDPWLTRHRLAQGCTREVRVVMSALLDADGIPDGIAYFVSPTTSLALVRQALSDHSESLTSVTELSMQLLEDSEQTRFETESQHRLLIENAVDYALFSLSLEGRVKMWNLGARRLHGYRSEDILGQHLNVFYPPEARERQLAKHALETALREGRFEDYTTQVRKNGSQFWAQITIAVTRDGSGQTNGYVVVLRDLTEQRQTLERQRLLSDSIEHNPDCVLITDADLSHPGPRILYANPSFERMSGYSLTQILGKTPRVFQGPDTNQEMLKRLRAALERKRIFVAETTNYRQDGTSYRVRWQIAPIFDGAGEVTHFVSLQRNISVPLPSSSANQSSFPEIIRVLDFTVSGGSWLPGTGLRGRLEDVGGAGSLVQMFSVSNPSGALILDGRIRLHLQGGRIVHIEHPRLTGMEAAVNAFALQTGSFEFTALNNPPESNMEMNPLSVALELARRNDEAAHSGEWPAPTLEAPATQGLLILPTLEVAVTFAISIGLEHFQANLQSDPSWKGQRVVLSGRGFRVVAIQGSLDDLPVQLKRGSK
jgi:PAS domain S-box-containing protein